MSRLLIVGASLAGSRAAQAARAAGFDGELTIVGDERVRPYDRPPLSKELLRGEKAAEDCALSLEGIEAKWVQGEAARHLDLGTRIVELESGARLGFDRLILATGSRARTWPGSRGGNLPGVVTLRGLGDAERLGKEIRNGGRITIIGAGFLGCEVAASARLLGSEAVLIDVAGRPMSALGGPVGEHCAGLHREHGVELRLGVGVEAILGDERVEAVKLADGSVVDSELVLVALGAEPNTGWLADSGLKLLDGGVVCDHQLQAIGAGEVWSAGDICAWPHPLSARPLIRVEHWTNAAEQGSLAGRNAAVDRRERRPSASLPSFWSDQYGSRFQAVGFPSEATEIRPVERSEVGDRLVAIGIRQERVVAALSVNASRRLPWYRRKIVERSPAADLIAELAEDSKSFALSGEMALL